MRKNKGFSLIEMLIIVAMIAALIAIAYPYFRGVMEKNKENADIAAMHSAEALLETAYNTRLIIENGSATEATATNPLYYDPSGKLTWTRPAPYGQGTDGNQGVTWSCCGDYAYNPANDYRKGVVVCYYTPDTGSAAYPGIHVHWDCDGTVITPDPVPKPTKPVFPERPTTEPTEGPTDPTTAPNPDPDPDPDPDPEPDNKPSGSGDFKDPIFKNLKSHQFPTIDENWQTTGYRLHLGHVYRYTSILDGVERIYISLDTDNGSQYYGPPWGTPDYNLKNNVVTPNGVVLTANGDKDGNYKLIPGETNVEYGTIFLDDDGTYYIFKANGQTTYPTGTESSKWVKINLNCPDGCGADVQE